MNRELQKLVEDARTIGVLTGAGISTESGIPDFRSPGGIWNRFRIIEYDEFIASEEARLEDWRRRFHMQDQLGEVRPNRGHEWIAGMVKTGKTKLVATQNIDGLHQRAGVPDSAIAELHGNAGFANCIDCHLRHEIDECRKMLQSTGNAPACRKCAGVVKSAVVMFGEAMPVIPMERADADARSCDLYLAIGSSLVVHPAASLPLIAKRSGATLAIINREPTELDRFADIVLHGEIGEILCTPSR